MAAGDQLVRVVTVNVEEVGSWERNCNDQGESLLSVYDVEQFL